MNESAMEIKSKYVPKIQKLNQLAGEIIKSGSKDKLGYLIPGMAKLTSMMVDCDQYMVDIDPDGEAVLVDRVVKINRYVQNLFLDMHGVDHVLMGGLFITVPVYLLPAHKVDAAINNRYKSILEPEKFGLPGNDLVNYCTYKPISPTAYMAVAKFDGNYANEVILTAKNYDYIYLK